MVYFQTQNVKILEGLEIENFDIFDGLLEFITDI
jgi:hypothetical protein